MAINKCYSIPLLDLFVLPCPLQKLLGLLSYFLTTACPLLSLTLDRFALVPELVGAVDAVVLCDCGVLKFEPDIVKAYLLVQHKVQVAG
jgi:hypothetical protein